MFNSAQPAYKSLCGIIAERTNRIMVWIGAGLSRPARLPSWSGLKDDLCRALTDKATAGDGEETIIANKYLKQIEKMNDYWLAFQVLRAALGPATYRATIRESLRPANNCDVPSIYSQVLDLPVTGILNLNLDRLATRAFSQKHPGKMLVEFSGFDVGQHTHILKGATPFIANLHGIVADESSWVLAKDDLRRLLKAEDYQTFIKSCLCTRTVIFIGISADDVAVGGHLENLSDAEVDLGDHFWITDHTDPITDFWSERTQIRLIRYHSHEEDHSELKELLEGLKRYVSHEEEAQPVIMTSTTDTDEIPSVMDLRQETDTERIREILNSYACKLLRVESTTSSPDYGNYSRFCKEYDEAIYRAWYVTVSPPKNKLLGYLLEREIADGAFGRVFRGQDSNGRAVAIKVLKEEVRRKDEMLQSFRRGVRSMRILADRDVQGMVPYEEASEIPAVAIMEFIEGPNLKEAVGAGVCDDWVKLLDIAVQLANIVRRAHMLPERVLHRDLRPPNIMLKDYYSDPEHPHVVVLDFDLSWHQGSQEISISHPSLGGFLAPEQVDRSTGMSTRSAAVDSFGLGMTLYFMRTRKEPQYLQHLHTTWEKDLSDSILQYRCHNWESVPVRFARLILNATKHSQNHRWDMGQIEGELELLKEAVNYPMRVRSTELLAEELTERVVLNGGFPRYRWDLNRIFASLRLPSGVELCIKPIEKDHAVEAQLEWSNLGDRQRKNIRKYLVPALDAATSSLQSCGWKILPQTYYSSMQAGFIAQLEVNQLVSNLELHTGNLVNVLGRFKF